MMERIVLLGAGGQVGREVQELLVERKWTNWFAYGSAELDITSDQDRKKILDLRPKFIINCAAYTKVDDAEDFPKVAFEVNAHAVKELAHISACIGACLIHLSTDYVYHNGYRRPLLETDPCAPKGVYARSKYEGEESIRSSLGEHYIIRTSWIYSKYSPNFVKTMLRLSKDREQLQVVNDQVGSPTHAGDLASWLLHFVQYKPDFGTYNLSNSGETSWFDLAKFIFAERQIPVEIRSVSTEAFGAKAIRPPYSVLNCGKADYVLDISRRPWKDAVKDLLRIL